MNVIIKAGPAKFKVETNATNELEAAAQAVKENRVYGSIPVFSFRRKK